MRKQQVTIFVSVLLVMVAAMAAQTPSQLERVNVVRDADTVRVEISAKGSVTPKLSSLDSPARVVVDLPETVMATGQHHIAVDSDAIKAVRIGMDGRLHPTTRVVVDLEKACAYELTPGPAGRLVLTLHANAAAPAAETGANSPAAPVNADLSPATKPATSPKDYVFVEPSYQAKSDTKPAPVVDEPTVRAQEAAARFSDKTAAELLPVSANAAQSGCPRSPARRRESRAGRSGVWVGELCRR